MDNQAVHLSEKEWQQVMGLISLAPWRDANPLLMKIGQQLQAQSPQQSLGESSARPLDGNGREIFR